MENDDFGPKKVSSETNDDVLPQLTLLHLQNAITRYLSGTSIEAMGVTLGRASAVWVKKKKPRLSEKLKNLSDSLSDDKATITREVLKTVCREIWQLLFGRQACRLQLNKDTGGFVILDKNLRPLEHLKGDPKEVELALSLWCGALQGAATEMYPKKAEACELKVQVRAEMKSFELSAETTFFVDLVHEKDND